MVASPVQPLIGRGAYTLAEAARFAKMRPQTMSTWFFGDQNAPLRPTYGDNTDRVLSFADLIQAVAIRTLRTSSVGKRVTLQHIRDVVQACDAMGVQYPLARSHQVYWFANRLIVRVKDQYVGIAPGVDKHQLYSAQIVEPFLQEVTFAPDDIATSWRPLSHDGFSIVLDANRRMGMPFVEPGGVLVSALVNAVNTEGSIEAAAESFEVPEGAVRMALKYEEFLSPAA